MSIDDHSCKHRVEVFHTVGNNFRPKSISFGVNDLNRETSLSTKHGH